MDRFATVRARGHKLLTGFMTLGDPGALSNQAAVYVDCGVDVLELGVPHADPFMDGPIVAQSMARALACGVTPAVARDRLESLRDQFPHTPIVLMGYHGLDEVARDPQGRPLADAILQPGSACPSADDREIARIGFISSAAAHEEIAAAKTSSAYVMLQANSGASGMRDSLSAANAAKIQRIRRSGVRSPILLGIGISTPEHAARAVQFGADGVVIGSACLQAASRGEAPLRDFLVHVRKALDSPAEFLR